jgi:NADPH2:quinone reductase
MKAAWFEEFGPADEVLKTGEQALPEIGPGDVLIRMSTSGVNPSDIKKRAGSFSNLLDDGPVIPHSDGAGVIEAVGSDVADSSVGERVWTYQAQYGRRFGTAAEYLAIEERHAVSLPENTSFDVGACLGIPAMTAHRCVFADGSADGQTLLITGGAGCVGYYAIADISSKLAAGELQHRVAHTVPFDAIASAHELIESGGFRGCVVLDLNA